MIIMASLSNDLPPSSALISRLVYIFDGHNYALWTSVHRGWDGDIASKLRFKEAANILLEIDRLILNALILSRQAHVFVKC